MKIGAFVIHSAVVSLHSHGRCCLVPHVAVHINSVHTEELTTCAPNVLLWYLAHIYFITQ